MKKNLISKRLQTISASSTLEISDKIKHLKSQGIDVISLAAGEPDFETPNFIKASAKKTIDQGNSKYTPVSGILDLKKAILKKFKQENNLSYDLEQILISNGAKQSIYNIVQTLIDPEDEVIILAPYWVSYPEIVRLAGGIPVFVNNENSINAKELKKVVSSRTKLLILNSPRNPDGKVFSESELRIIGNFCVENNIYILSDEIYEKFIFEGLHISIASLSKEIYNKTITVNGFSKAFAIPGWRIGYCAGNTEIIKAASVLQSHSTSGPNNIAQIACVSALNEKFDLNKILNKYKENRDYIINEINSIKEFRVKIPQGAFYAWVDISSLLTKKYSNASSWCDDLLEKKLVAVMPGNAFGDDKKIRISLASNLGQIQEAMKRIKEFVFESKRV